MKIVLFDIDETLLVCDDREQLPLVLVRNTEYGLSFWNEAVFDW